MSVGAGSSEKVSSCGRSDSASGTEGKFDIYDGDNRVCTVYWSCPWFQVEQLPDPEPQ